MLLVSQLACQISEVILSILIFNGKDLLFNFHNFLTFGKLFISNFQLLLQVH